MVLELVSCRLGVEFSAVCETVFDWTEGDGTGLSNTRMTT